MSRRLPAKPVVRVSSPSSPALRAEPLEDRMAPAVLTATIDPVINNPAAVAELINLFQTANANKEADEINLFPGGPYVFNAAAGANTALPVLVVAQGGAGDTVTINGRGASLTRASDAGTPDFRLLTITTAKSGATTQPAIVRDLTVRNGRSSTEDGGGVRVDNTVAQFENVKFLANEATGTGRGGGLSFTGQVSGKVVIRDSLFDGNKAGDDGGGVFLDGSVTIAGSTFSNNESGGRGGGVSNEKASLDVTGSLFTGNKADGTGGGLVLGGSSTVKITNSTLHSNFSGVWGGGVYVTAGAIGQLLHSTVTDNTVVSSAGGGGIDVDSSTALVIGHTVVYGNKNGNVAAANTESDMWGRYTSQGFNFVGIGAKSNFLIWTPTTTDQTGTFAAPIDGKLGPLQLNGGPTRTRAPLQGSKLIDAGATSVTPNADQRGYPRRVGPTADIGAVEIQVDVVTKTSRPSIIVTDGDEQVTALNSNFVEPLQVTVVDAFGVPVGGREVFFSGPGVTFPAGARAVSGADGKAEILAFANDFVGLHRVTALLVGDNLTAEFRLVNKPGEGAVDPAGGNNQAAVVTTQYADRLVAQAFRVDAAGVRTPLANATLLFAVVPGAAGGTLENGGTVLAVTTDAEGKASTTFTANTKAGAVRVVAAAAQYGAAVFDLTNLPDAPATLALLSGSGQATPILTNFPDPLAVVTTDKYGNPVGGVPVNFAGQTDPTVAGVTFPAGSAAVSDAAGVARLVVGANAKIGPHQVTATSPAVAGLITFDLANQQGPAATVTLISGSGQSVRVTGTFPAPLVVEVRDAGGNLIPGIGVNFAGPGSGASAAFPFGATAITGADGRAALTVGANSKAGRYAVVGAIPGATQATFELTNLAGSPALITVVDGDGQATPVNTRFPEPILVRSIDEFGNPVAGAVPAVAVVGSDGAGATFVVTPAGDDGIAAVVATANGAVGSYRAQATLPGLSVLFDLTNTAPAGGLPAAPLTGLATEYVVGAGPGTPHRLWVYNDADQLVSEFQPYDVAFAGGVRAVVLRTPEGTRVVTGPGPGRFADVRVFGTDGQLIRSHTPFEGSFSGGVYLAAADVNRDGWDDYAVSADEGGGPRVQVVSGIDGSVLADFFGIADPNFRGGARVALGDVSGDGVPDLVVAAGFGGGPRLALFDGTSLGGGTEPRRLVDDFFVFEPTLRNGVFVAAGDVDGDGKYEVVVGAGPGGGPRVVTLSGADLVINNQRRINDFFAGDVGNRNGVRVTLKDLDDDNLADLVTGAGAGDGTRVTVYPGRFLVGFGSTGDVTSFDQQPGVPFGVFVG